MLPGRKPDLPNKHKMCKDPDFPERLERLRLSAELEIKDLCSIAQISRSYYCRLRNGSIPQPGQKALLGLAEALNTTVDALWQANSPGVDRLSLKISSNLTIEVEFRPSGSPNGLYYRARNQIIADIMKQESEWRRLMNNI